MHGLLGQAVAHLGVKTKQNKRQHAAQGKKSKKSEKVDRKAKEKARKKRTSVCALIFLRRFVNMSRCNTCRVLLFVCLFFVSVCGLCVVCCCWFEGEQGS